MSLYGGIDLHANNSVVVLLNDQDQVIYQKRLPNALSTILEAFAPYSSEIEGFVVESTYNWYWRVDGLTLLCGRNCQALLSAFLSFLAIPPFSWCVLDSSSHVLVVR
jgi:hypothetical protein